MIKTKITAVTVETARMSVVEILLRHLSVLRYARQSCAMVVAIGAAVEMTVRAAEEIMMVVITVVVKEAAARGAGTEMEVSLVTHALPEAV
jgi:glycerate-2-kinase